MRAPGVALLAALGIAVLAGGWYFGTATTPAERTTATAGAPMFPDLAPRLGDAAKLEITHQGKQTVVEKRADGGWGLASMNDYPIQDAKLRGLLIGLLELRLTEPRTTDPAQYGRLGVDDPNAAGSSGNLLRVMDSGGKTILAVIVGHRRVRGQANLPDAVYVRRPDEDRSWLAEGNIQADADASAWLDRDVINVGHDRIASVVVGDKALVFGRADGTFALTEPAEHPKLEGFAVENVARGLEQLTFQQVRAGGDAPGTEAGHSVFTTDDGLAVTVTVSHADNKDVWARFAVSGPSDKPEADRLNKRLAGWSYQIGSWKEKSLVPTIDDLKAAEPAAPAPDADNK